MILVLGRAPNRSTRSLGFLSAVPNALSENFAHGPGGGGGGRGGRGGAV